MKNKIYNDLIHEAFEAVKHDTARAYQYLAVLKDRRFMFIDEKFHTFIPLSAEVYTMAVASIDESELPVLIEYQPAADREYTVMLAMYGSIAKENRYHYQIPANSVQSAVNRATLLLLEQVYGPIIRDDPEVANKLWSTVDLIAVIKGAVDFCG